VLFAETGGDCFNATPSRMAQYIALPSFRDALAKCRVVMCGGEKYPPKLLAQLKEITHARIFNTYGPTEITVSCNAKELTGETDISVGPPLLNVDECIVDADGNTLPPGLVGELYVGGAGVAKGYLNQEALTEKSFVMHNGQRVYKTGDFAKWTNTGDVVILGRRDSQVKLRGLRIELGEIEKAIIAHPNIAEAVAGVREIGETEYLCAWFTSSVSIDHEELKTRLEKTLTAYMIPSLFCQLDAMPTTPNGKVDTKALITPALQKSAKGEAPKDETEAALCGIFAASLKLESVGATDDFFALGGTSLAVTGVLIEAGNKGLAISYGDVFAHPTPRGLAQLLKGDTANIANDKDDTKSTPDYDYSSFDAVLAANTLKAFSHGEKREIGNLLLTGAAGFLGIHVLRAFLENEQGTAFCILRGKAGIHAEERLKTQLFYYFENNYEDLFGTRIKVIEGDVTNSEWAVSLEHERIDTVINCAALVKHFASGSEIEDVNVGGVQNLIDFCRGKHTRLIQISTASVAGERVDGLPAPKEKLTEQRFYFGQDLENKYIYSKFLAERLVLEAITNGMDAKIMRVGNLAARQSDGEFQINSATNGFMGRLRAYSTIGAFPYSAMNKMVEMAPIDSTADAILLLSKTPASCCVFHPFNNHYVPLGDIVLQMGQMGIDVRPSEDEAYREALSKAQANPEKARILTSLLAYENRDESQQREVIESECEYTSQILYRLGFAWPMTSRPYMNNFLNALETLGFFDKEEIGDSNV
jgi:thioester reductase-like protein